MLGFSQSRAASRRSRLHPSWAGWLTSRREESRRARGWRPGTRAHRVRTDQLRTAWPYERSA
jgi:hypothetical protein